MIATHANQQRWLGKWTVPTGRGVPGGTSARLASWKIWIHGSEHLCRRVQWKHKRGVFTCCGSTRAVASCVPLCAGDRPRGESHGVGAYGSDCHPAWPPGFLERRSWQRDVTAMMALQLKNGDAAYYQSAEYCRNYTSPPVSYGDSSHYLARLPGKERLAMQGLPLCSALTVSGLMR